MKINNVENKSNGLLKDIFSLFCKVYAAVWNNNPAKTIKRELDALWKMGRQSNEGLYTEKECREKITKSFVRVRENFSNDILDSVNTWPRYVKVAIQYVEEPIDELIDYVDEGNYKRLTKRLADLSHSVYKSEENEAKINIEKFSESVYLHILDSINAVDAPSCLALGKIHQKRTEYAIARNWFERIISTDDYFNGVTALLSCYEEEIKAILLHEKNRHLYDSELGAKVKSLNAQQCAIYEKWCAIAEEDIKSSDGLQDQCKQRFVSLVTGYARLEKNRGNYHKAIELLNKVPDSYPEVYRVYAEEAMLYQCKPYKNRYYSLEKAIEAFNKAEKAINVSGTNSTSNIKSQKSILMPLANTYFRAGRYEEAESVCDRILRIDAKEQRAIDLKKRISSLVA